MNFGKFILEDKNNKQVIDDCRELMASLKASQWMHQANFWLVKGENHYGLHEMMKHILDPIDEQMNDLGNIFVSNFGEDCMNPEIIDLMSKSYCREACRKDNLILKSITVENQVQNRCKIVYNSLKEAGLLTLGLDEMLMGIAKEHEDSLYHLRQTSKK